MIGCFILSHQSRIAELSAFVQSSQQQSVVDNNVLFCILCINKLDDCCDQTISELRQALKDAEKVRAAERESYEAGLKDERAKVAAVQEKDDKAVWHQFYLNNTSLHRCSCGS